MDYGRETSGDCNIIKSDGTTVTADPVTGLCTLGVATYYIPLGTQKARTPAQTSIVDLHLKWSAALAATITIETSNFPQLVGGDHRGAADVTDISTTAGDWIQQNPSTAYVPCVGSGNSASAATVTAGGSAAGGCEFTLSGLGSKRVRAKVVVTVGGTMRANVHGKLGA